MRPITPLVASDFHGRVQNMIQRFEVNIDGAWVDLTGYESVEPVPPDVVNTDLVVHDMTHAHTANNVILFYNTAGVVYAASCEYADVQTAVNAASTGDTVYIPAGSATWATYLSVAKDIHIKGAGIYNTIISHSGIGIRITGSEGNSWSISGIEFVKSNNASASIHIYGDCKRFRIHHCYFNNYKVTVQANLYSINMQNTGSAYSIGLIDNCSVLAGRFLINAGSGDAAWKDASDLGGSNAVYIEDCDFDAGETVKTQNCVDTDFGARLVVRNCTLRDTGLMTHSLISGFATYFNRGTRLQEFYNNTITASRAGYTLWIAIWPRAGTGMVFNNEVRGENGQSYSYAVGIDNVRTYETKGGLLGRADGGNIIDGNLPIASGTGEGSHTGANNAATLTCSGKTWTANEFAYSPARYYVWNLTDGSRGPITANTADTITAVLAGGTDNDWDNGDTFKISDGYPALDQIGRGQDVGGPVEEQPTYTATSRQPQAVEPMYIWNNTLGGSLQNPSVRNDTGRHVTKDRDFYRQESGFDGSTGIGVGLRSARPSNADMSGMAAGVAWWATDESKLYRWNGTIWVQHYTPYTYPHPLRSDPILGD